MNYYTVICMPVSAVAGSWEAGAGPITPIYLIDKAPVRTPPRSQSFGHIQKSKRSTYTCPGSRSIKDALGASTARCASAPASHSPPPCGFANGYLAFQTRHARSLARPCIRGTQRHCFLATDSEAPPRKAKGEKQAGRQAEHAQSTTDAPCRLRTPWSQR